MGRPEEVAVIRPAALLLLSLAAPLAVPPGQGAPPVQEAAFKKSIAAAWERLATWCAAKKLATEAKLHAGEALALDPDNAKAKAAKAADGDSAGASEADRKEYASKLAAAKRQAAGLYQKWAAAPHDAKDDAIHDERWGRALELDPKAVGPLYEAEWRQAIQKQQWRRVGALISRADEVLGPDPRRSAALRDAEAKSSDVEPFLKKASTHPLRYWFSLPKGWTPARTWPVLVVVDGAGCGFYDQCRNFMGQRGDLGLIVIAPCTFANTNGLEKAKYPWYPQELLDEVDKAGRLKWDDAGLMAVLADLRRDYKAEEKFFITGFSGGGNLTWWNTLTRPASLRGSFPACANFFAKPDEAPPDGKDVPIRAFQGDKDEYLQQLDDQWRRAEGVLQAWGYTNYSRTPIPGAGHVPAAKEVLDQVRSLLKTPGK